MRDWCHAIPWRLIQVTIILQCNLLCWLLLHAESPPFVVLCLCGVSTVRTPLLPLQQHIRTYYSDIIILSYSYSSDDKYAALSIAHSTAVKELAATTETVRYRTDSPPYCTLSLSLYLSLSLSHCPSLISIPLFLHSSTHSLLPHNYPSTLRAMEEEIEVVTSELRGCTGELLSYRESLDSAELLINSLQSDLQERRAQVMCRWLVFH